MITAETLIRLLASRHWKDIFIKECKNGGSESGHLRLDGWAMKKSWSNPLTIGYEIKVSRSDFLGDNKWQGYLQYCNEFYFVCPSGLIQPDEIGEGIGLLWASKTGTRLYCKKKAAYREQGVNIENVLRYILYWRAEVKSGTYPEGTETQTEYWQRWMGEKDEEKRLGWKVSTKIRQIVTERIDKVESDNRILKSENEKLAYIKDEIEKLGFKDGVPSEWLFDREMKALKKIVPEELTDSLEKLNTHLGIAIKTIKEMESK